MKRVLAGILAVTMTFSGAVLPGEQVWKSAGVISASAETWSSVKSLSSDITVSGPVQTNSDIILNGHTLTINGDLYMTAGMLDIGTGKLVVNGNLYIGKEYESSYAYIRMQNSSASITVTGDLIWNVNSKMTNTVGRRGWYTYDLITAGTINVAGNVYDYISTESNHNAFTMMGTSVLNLNGSGIQTIKCSYQGELAKIKVTDNRTIDMEGYFYSTTPLASDLNIRTQNGLKITTMVMGGKTVSITGNVTQFERDIELGGGTLNITGTFTAEGGMTKLGGGKLNVNGDYRIARVTSRGELVSTEAGLDMTNSNDVVNVSGDFIIMTYSYATTSKVTMTSGKVYVGGNFESDTTKITFGSGNTVYMNGTVPQTVKLSNSKKIYNLVLIQNLSQYNSDIANYAVNLETNQPKITADDVTLSANSYVYDGTAKQPSVTVKVDSNTLTKGTDYTVTYSNNTNAGTASVTVKGIGSYQGTVTKNFTINKKNMSSLEMTLSQTSYTYDGNAKKPTVTVKDGSRTLVSGTDYTVSYSNNTAVGTATATVTGKGNYTGTQSANYTISSAKAISSCTISLGTTSYTYDGTAKQPSVTITDGSKTLTKGTDFTVAYTNNTKAGTATVTITGKGSYSGTAAKTFTISAKSVSNVTITLSVTSYTYDGTAKKPSVTVKDGSKTLTSGTDYSVSYSNNINAGTATVTITGKGNYTGTKAASFTISSPEAKAISGCTVTLGTSSYTYDGSAKQPSVTVKDGTKTLTKGTDFTVAYSNNTNAGTATVTITGNGSYTGTVTKTFTILAKSAGNLTATLSATSYTYDGTAKKPTITVKDGSKTLTNGTDYSVSYSNNTNAGTAKVTVTGKGNYTGTLSKNFTISAKRVSGMTMTLSPESCTYDGTAKKPAVIVADGDTILESGTDYTVAYSSNTVAGTAKVTVTGKGNYSGTLTKNFTINAKKVGDLTITLSQTSYTYDGTAKKPTVTVKDGSKTLTSGTDYAVSYSNNTNVGTASVAITGKGNYTGTVTESFTISKAAAVSISGCTVTLGTSSYTYDGTAKQPSVTVKNGTKTLTKGTDFTVAYTNNTNAGTATVIVSGIGNYKDTVTKTFTISAKSASNLTVTLSATSYTYDGTAKKPTITVKDGSKTLTNGTDYSVSYSNNTNAGTAKVTVTGKGNYTGTLSKNFTISAKRVSGMTMTLSPESCTYDGTAKKPAVIVADGDTILESGTDYTVAYSSNTVAGTAKVTVTGKGNYSGTLTKNFTIAAKSISELEITLSQTSYTYNGSAKKPAVTVKDGSKTLVSGTDYSVSYSDNTNVGTATVTITGSGNYKGTAAKTFTISQPAAVSISGCTVTLGTSGYTYDGTAKKPAVTVKDGSKALTKGTDYTVEYYNNINTGTASVTIMGMGRYTGTVTKSFTINAKNASNLTVSVSPSSFTYDGTAKTPAVTVKDGSKTLENGTDFTVSYSNNTNVGTATVTITGKGNYTGTKSASFSISQPAAVSISNCTVSLGTSSYTYDGSAKQPTVTVKDGSKTLTKGTDYTVAYSNNTNAGTATVTVTGMGSYKGTVSRTFTISAKSAGELTMTLSQTSFTYDGTAKKPTVTVKDGSKTLVSGTDYTVSYSNNTNAGTAVVTITGKGNYTGTKSANFTISGASATPISSCTITLGTTSYTYDGNAKTPSVTVKYGSKTLTNGTDYTVSYSNNVNVGTATVTITGKGSYSGTATKTFTISEVYIALISNCNITLSASSYTYDGTAKKPTVTVKDGSKTLTAGTDYTVAYADNINVGTASVTITGKGTYSGSVTRNFTISEPAAVSISGCTVTLSATSYTYDGSEKKPSVTVKNGSTTLVNGTDYLVSYSNNTNAGTASVTIMGNGRYTGSVTKNFTINAKSASSLTASVSPTSYTYDGKAKTPAVTVKDGSRTLMNGVDYTVSYSANTEVGTAKVNITFIGNYTGSKTVSFTISKAAPASITKCAITLGTTNYTYDGTAKKPAVNVINGSDALAEGTDFTVAYSNNTKAGTATVTIKGIGNFNDTTTKTFTISPKNASALTVTVSPASYTYDGKEKKPTVIVKDGTNTLVSGTDYTVSYSNNINAGTASAVITFKGNYTGTKSASFTISEPAAVAISSCMATLSKSTYAYDGSEKKPAVTVNNGSASLTNGVDYIVSYTDNINAGTATVNIMGLGRYTGSLTKTFTISQRSASNLTAVVSPSSYTYDGNAKQPDVTVTDGTKTLTNGKDYTLAYSNNVNAGTAGITVKGTGNYTGSISKTFRITAKSVSELNITLSGTAFTYDGSAKQPTVTVSYGSKKLVSGTDFTVSYSNNTRIGTATVTVTGKGNFTGTKTANFTINKAEAVNIASCKAYLSADSFVYDGMAKKPVPTVKRGDKTLRNGLDYTYDYDNNINAGTASVIVTGIGEYAGTGTLNFTISPAPLNNIRIAVLTNNYIYDGTEKKPAVTVTEGMNTLTEGADYYVTYGNNVEAGTASVYVNGTGNYTGMKSAEFTITAKDADSNNIAECSIELSEKSAEYTGSAVTPGVIVRDGTEVLTNNVDYSVDYVANVNTGTAKVIITGMGDYQGIYEDSFTITAKSAKSLDVTVSPESYEYNGTARKPKVTVKDGSRVLTEKTDYTLAYSDNIIAGNAVVKISFTGNYSGTVTKSFKINTSDISKASIKLEKYYYDANGAARRPSVTIEKDGRTLVENRDYRVTYSSNTSAGTAYVSISGQGNYYGTLTQPFVIGSASAVSISGFNISMDTRSYAYDGTAKKPQITLTNGSATLKEHQDFEVAYYNNINAGRATVIVIGRNGYKDIAKASFTITPKSLAGAQAALSAVSFEYDENPKTPVVTVNADNSELTEGRDFTVEYKNNTAAGTASAVITGTGNYSGSTEKKFTINGKNAACLNVVLENKEYAYSGKAAVPKVKVYDGSKLLTEGTDYSVTYVNNTAVGAAKAVITCMGNYSGVTSAGFAIVDKSASKVKKGDVNGDGIINVNDLTKAAAHVKGRKLLVGDQFKAADINGDGKINVSDISLIAAHIKGKKLLK